MTAAIRHCDNVLAMFYVGIMIESHTMPATEAAISTAFLTAPGWVRVGITAPKERIRQEVAQELARAILASATQSPLAL